MPPEAVYLIKAFSALLIFSICAFIFVHYMKVKGRVPDSKEVKVITSLRLSSRDLFFVIKCGPDVIAFTLGNNGTYLIGRWNYEEWIKSKEINN